MGIVLIQFLQMLLCDIGILVWLGCGLFLAGIIEVYLWKTKPFALLNRPIHVRWFGENKRWRGLVSLPLAHVVSVLILQYVERAILHTEGSQIFILSTFNAIEYGLLMGFVFNLSELPNSFFKRRLGIPAGEDSHPVFYWVDHMDSPYGSLLLLYVYFHFPFHLIAVGVVTAPIFYIWATVLRKKLGLK